MSLENLTNPESKGALVLSGAGFDLISEKAKEHDLKTLGIVSADLGDEERLSTPIVVDKLESVFILTQDSDHVVLTKNQAESLKKLLDQSQEA